MVLNRWQLYSALKEAGLVTSELLAAVEEMDAQELREGVIEYLLTLLRNGR